MLRAAKVTARLALLGPRIIRQLLVVGSCGEDASAYSVDPRIITEEPIRQKGRRNRCEEHGVSPRPKGLNPPVWEYSPAHGAHPADRSLRCAVIGFSPVSRLTARTAVDRPAKNRTLFAAKRQKVIVEHFLDCVVLSFEHPIGDP